MVRSTAACPGSAGRSPRAGGGGPGISGRVTTAFRFAPRRRGWSADHSVQRDEYFVRPAQAGVVRGGPRVRTAPPRSPRAGGGGPVRPSSSASFVTFAPRRRGWSAPLRLHVIQLRVRPAQAGVVRPARRSLRRHTGSPRAGGGGPGEELGAGGLGGSPRAGGGGPAPLMVALPVMRFAPRRRGWSGGCAVVRDRRGVRPAQAGVVRRGRSALQHRSSSPRAGGGGPSWAKSRTNTALFAPRRRGWSAFHAAPARRDQVRPAQAGVVRVPCCSCPA